MQGKGIELTESNEQLANCLAIIQPKKKGKSNEQSSHLTSYIKWLLTTVIICSNKFHFIPFSG